MASSYDKYDAAMRGDTWKGWWLTWPLSNRVRIGQAFATDDGKLRTAGDLAERDIGFEVAPVPMPANYTYTSNGSATVRFKLAGDVPQGFSALAQAEAGALIQFRSSSAVLVVYSGLTQAGMSNTWSVAGDLVGQYWNGSWPEDLVVVTAVITATGGTVLAADQVGASVELRAGANIGTGPAELVDLAGNITLARADQVGLQWVGQNVTPFYQVLRLKRTWLNQVKTQYGPRQPGRGAAPDPVPPILLEEARDDPDQVLEPVSQEHLRPAGRPGAEPRSGNLK